MKLSKTMRKVWAYVCAVALIVTSITVYRADAVGAATLEKDGASYTIGTITGNITGFVCQGAFDGIRFGFAWGDADVSTVSVQIQKNEETVEDLGTMGNGLSVTLTNLASLDAGEYKIIFTSTSDATKVQEAALTISGEVVTTTEAPYVDGGELLSDTAFKEGSVSNWNEYDANGASFTNNGDGSVSVAVPEVTGGDNYAHQLVQNGLTIVEGKWYVAKYTVTSDVDKTFQLIIQSDGAAGGDWSVYAEEFTAVKAGETKEVELKFQASKSGKYNVLFGIMMGYVQDTGAEAANVTISNVSFKTYTDEPTGDVTETTAPVETTTEAPVETTEEPTTILAWDENAELSITEAIWGVTNGKKTFDVTFTPVSSEQTGDADPYLYCIYLDEVDSDHSAINLDAEWNWKNNFQWLNPAGGFNNGYKFDKVFSTAAGYAANGTASTYLEDGAEHKVIIVAYKTVAEAQADVNPVAKAELALEIPAEIETTTIGDAEEVADINITSAVIDANNGITVDWVHPEGMESYTQEFYLGMAGEVVEDEAHWARNGTADWVWGQVSGRTQIDNVVSTKDRSLDVAKGGDFVVRIVYLKDGLIVARGTTAVLTFEEKANTNMAAFQERNEGLKAYLKWTKVTGATSYKVYDAEGTLVKDNVVADWADVDLAAYDTEYEYTIKAYNADGGEIEVTNNVVKAKVAKVLSAPEGLTNAPAEDGSLPYYFAWAPVEEAVSYNVYVNGTLVASVVDPSYDAAGYFATAEAGTYTVEVAAVSASGVEGAKATTTYVLEGEDTTTEDTTTASDETTTEAPEETTTGTTSEMVWEQCVVNGDGDETRYPIGNYEYYVGAWNGSTAQVAVDPEDADHIKAQQLSSLWYDAWGFQIAITKSGLTPGETYTIEVDMNASVADGTYKTDASEDTISLVAGVNKLSRTAEADAEGNIKITAGLGWVGVAVELDFSNVVVKDAAGNVVYPKDEETTTEEQSTETDETTEAPTDATTAAPDETTTKDETTTVAPDETTTKDETTTVAPDETTTAKVKAPARAKIKKVNAKKKSAKAVKISLKKIKGAKGYQVAIYKTRKNAKKNKKALVKKIVKKRKVTIKSKKLKNKSKLFVKARAYVLDANGKKVYGKWSKVKSVKIKK